CSGETVLPTDLDIFSPSAVTNPLCIQKFANRSPAAQDCASSFSWCGNRRSKPPPWISKWRPKYLVAIAEHSMCQPGRPSPHGDAHAAPAGSESSLDFHSVKSRGSFLPRVGESSASCIISTDWWVSAP